MSTNSSIEWTDTTWQVTAGCTRVSEGCRHCYAERMAGRLAAMAQADQDDGRDPGKKRVYLNVVNQRAGTGLNGFGPKSGWNNKVVTLPERLAEPLAWKRPRRVFVNSESDLFHKDVPFDFIFKVYAAMVLAGRHTFQVLTKRPERAAEFYRQPNWFERLGLAIREVGGAKYEDGLTRRGPLSNIWLGTSCERQQEADERIPHLLRCPAAVRFVSAEPLLGPIDFDRTGADWMNSSEGIDWVIVGGESGHGARPCHVEWVRSIVVQCGAADVACFVKQLGAMVLWDGCQGGYGDGPSNCWPEGTKRTDFAGNWRVWLRDGKGGDPAEWSEDLRVRQFPNGPAVGLTP
jgi:protein gp37